MLSGEVVVSKRIKRVYKKIINDLADPKSKYYFNFKFAELAIDFIESFCVHTIGKLARKPFVLEIWQKAMLELVFGVLRKKDHKRRFRTVLLLIGRKNGKTALAANIAIKCLMADFEEGAEVYSLASKKDQAKIVFKAAQNMISVSPLLRKKLKKLQNEIYFASTLSSMKPLASKSDTLDGLNPSFCNIDEMHAIKDRNIYDVITSAVGSREQPLLLITTTNGTVREALFDEEYDYAVNVVNGTFEDDEYLPLLYELDTREEWTDPKMWQKANPNLGISFTYEYLEKQVEKAKNSAAYRTGVLTKHFNIKQTSKNRFLDYTVIEKNNKVINLDLIRDKYCTIGFDLSKTTDLTCADILVPFTTGDLEGQIFNIPLFFIPEEIALEKVKEDNVPYDRWEREGYIYFTPGRSVSQEFVFETILTVLDEYQLTPLLTGYDDWYAHELVKLFENHGLELSKVIQGFKTLSSPMVNLGAMFEESKVIYNNNPCMRWNIANTATETDAKDNIKPTKAVKRQRIDGFAAMLNAFVAYERTKDHFEALEN